MHRVPAARIPLAALVALAAGLLLIPLNARAGEGFRVGRYEPSVPGASSFWVDDPWFRPTHDVTFAFTLDYAHKPLVFGVRTFDDTFSPAKPIIAHQLLGHLGAAFSPLPWLEVSLSLPLSFHEAGTPAAGIEPRQGLTPGDPRLGAMALLSGDPVRGRFALSAGLLIWIPTGGQDLHAGDAGLRAMPKMIASGRYQRWRWSGSLGFLYRPEASLGTLPAGSGNTVGSEAQAALRALFIADENKRWGLGPEVVAATVVTGGHAFRESFTSLELLFGVHRRIEAFTVSIAAGAGFLREPGTPDFRALLRLAWAPPGGRRSSPDPALMQGGTP